MEIFEKIFLAGLEEKISLLENHYSQTKKDFEIHKDQKSDLKKLLCNMQARWKESYSKLGTFCNKNKNWSESSVTLKVKA